jgi:hypothetical protein
VLISSRLVQALTLVVVGAAADPVGAQLRPLEPFSWHIFQDGITIAADARISRYQGQRASLAGTKGDLWEVPTAAVALVSGRFAIISSGTCRIFFKERLRFGPAYS